MRQALQRRLPWVLVWCVITLLGGVVLGRLALAQLREAFETDARIAHRLLSQRVVQHDAVMATLALLQAPRDASQSAPPEQRLASVYPQILGVQRRDPDGLWPRDSLRLAEAQSRQSRRAVLSDVDFARGRYQLVLGADPASYALLIDLRSTVPWGEWPMPPDSSPVRLTLEYAGQSFLIQPGQASGGGWRFDFHKHLATDSQPFDVVALRQVGWHELPWGRLLAWAAGVAAVLAALMALQRQRAGRRRAEELLRLGQVARLNALGELAAGMAHELNQPLTAVLASTQAAKRLLNEEPPELPTARNAMDQAVEQARRASEVVGRLRRAIERPDLARQTQAMDLEQAGRRALYLLEPECRHRAVVPEVLAADPVRVLAEPVALEQIIHNLLMNALQALDTVAAGERRLTLAVTARQAQAELRVIDSGPGITPEALPRLFEPFFTTREGGLGLGLSLCETLAGGMGGRLRAEPNSPRGAVFILTLPLAPSPGAPA